MAALLAGDEDRSATSAAQQAAPAGGPRGAIPQDPGPRGQWRPDFGDQSLEAGYGEWGTSPNSEWGEPQYGGWSPEPSGKGWGSEPSATGQEDSHGQWGAPRSPGTESPDQGGSEGAVASSPGRRMVDPWATGAQSSDAPPAAQAAESPSAQAAEPPSVAGQPAATAAYPMQPPLPPAGVPPIGYGGYPGYGAGAPPPPPPGWGYGYPGYGGPPGPYGGPGAPSSGRGGGWPWGDMMPWGNRGGGNSPWSNWMPWGK